MHAFSIILAFAAALQLPLAARGAPVPGIFDALGLGDINIDIGDTSDTAPTPVSQEDISGTLVRPALFARVAYCSSARVQDLSCGEQCDALGGNVTVLATGGDGGRTPRFYVAHDAAEDQIVVAHQGTDPKNLLSDLNDINFIQVDANTTVLPDAGSESRATFSWAVRLTGAMCVLRAS